MRELAGVLRKYGAEGKLDLLGTNACAMSYAEAVYELQGLAQFLIASEITMPFSGWPYVPILQKLGACSDVAQAGELIVDEFMESFDRKGVALSLVNLDQAKVLSSQVTRLAKALQRGIATPEVGQQVTEAFLDSAHGDVRPIIDLSDLCLNLSQTVGDKAIVSAASMLRDELKILTDGTPDARRQRLIVKHEADADFEGLHGLGIFAPAVTSGADLRRLEVREKDYGQLKLIRATKQLWAQLVYRDLGSLLASTNAAIAELVAGTGASAQDDREGVAQLLVAVTRSFDKLDSTLAKVESSVGHALGGPAATGRPHAARTAAHAKPSLTFLRLTIDAQTFDATGRSNTLRTALPPGGLRDDVHVSLRLLEDGVASVERLLRRVLTNGRLGLGAGESPFKAGLGSGLGADDPFKPGLGAGDPPFKPGLGAGDDPFKPGLGEIDDPFKPGLGEVDDPFKPGLSADDPFKPGLGVTREGALMTGSMLTVADLFRLVALSLRGIELTLARLEKSVLGANFPVTISVEEARQRTVQQAGRHFKTLKDQVVSARETSLWVLRHPTQGLGPGLVVGSAGRKHLASVGGLSSRNLQLL